MPSLRLSELLRREIAGQLDLFASLWPGYEEPANTNSPHRQRTAVNRLMGYAMFLGIDTSKESKQATSIRKMRDWQKRLGTLRDLDVSREWIAKCIDASEDARSGGEALDLRLQERRKRELEKIRPDAKGLPGAEARIAAEEVRQQFGEALKKLDSGKSRFDRRKSIEEVAQPWRERRDLLLESHGNDDLHSFRVANKRYRFVLDVLAEVGEDAKYARVAETLLEIHTTLGSLSDLWVLRDRILLFRAERARQPQGAPIDMDALESARARLEKENYAKWFEIWATLKDGATA